jgi:hypothetical protein
MTPEESMGLTMAAPAVVAMARKVNALAALTKMVRACGLFMVSSCCLLLGVVWDAP